MRKQLPRIWHDQEKSVATSSGYRAGGGHGAEMLWQLQQQSHAQSTRLSR
jgi:hypothetical protein